MAFRSVVSTKMPMVIVLGATGTGKTKLGVELAQKYKTEVISADSMQIYKGLDVVTAKATELERGLVPHHLLDILEPTQMFTVVDFRNRALNIIENLTHQGKIPIIVGGTNYYVESIVYNILVENMDDSKSLLWDVSRRKRDLNEKDCNSDEGNVKKKANDDADKRVSDTDVVDSNVDNHNVASASETEAQPSKQKPGSDEILKEKILNIYENEDKLTSEEIHNTLKSFDPVMAGRLHPNNRRKILRSIEVWLKTGRKHSEVLEEQKVSEGQLRRPGATIIFWLKCDQKVHDERLDARVDAMLKDGLIKELLDFHEQHNKQRILDGQSPDYTKGIFQTLGFKEFHEYLMLTEDERNSVGGKKLLQVCIENMKSATKRYARRQNKMIKARFLEHPKREIPLIYELNTTDPSCWKTEVTDKATHIIDSFLSGLPCQFQPLTSDIDEEKRNFDGNSSNYCDVCKRIIIGDNTFKIHLNSYRHQKVLKKKKLQETEKKSELKPSHSAEKFTK